MPRFVILRHEPGPESVRPLHWDLMLEQGETLRTWALPDEPSIGASFLAVELPAHRKEFLNYTGPVSRGRGAVDRFDTGCYECSPLGEDQFKLLLQGERAEMNLSFSRVAHSEDQWSVSIS